jgi:hypothetical protein
MPQIFIAEVIINRPIIIVGVSALVAVVIGSVCGLLLGK